MKFVLKRDSKLEPFDQERITQAIWKAAKAVGGKDKEQAKRVSDQVVAELNKLYGDDGVPTVEEVQDLVEKQLIENGHASTAKAYILYRKQHNDMRELAALLSSADLVDQYLEVEDWRVKENSNMSYSLQGLNNYLSSTVIAKYWISRIYPAKIAESHFSGELHIHDLGVLGPILCRLGRKRPAAFRFRRRFRKNRKQTSKTFPNSPWPSSKLLLHPARRSSRCTSV